MRKRVLSTLFWGFVTVSSILLFPIAAVIRGGDGAVRSASGGPASLHLFLGVALHLVQSGVAGHGRGARRRSGAAPPTSWSPTISRCSTSSSCSGCSATSSGCSKVENFKVPFIGWNMRLNQYIELRRGDRGSIMQMMKACERTLDQGNSIMMFPEGTRSSTGDDAGRSSRVRSSSPARPEHPSCRSSSPVRPMHCPSEGSCWQGTSPDQASACSIRSPPIGVRRCRSTSSRHMCEI